MVKEKPSTPAIQAKQTAKQKPVDKSTDRVRLPFLEAYQALVLDEPISGVSQPLKETFLNLRRAAEYNNNTD